MSAPVSRHPPLDAVSHWDSTGGALNGRIPAAAWWKSIFSTFGRTGVQKMVKHLKSITPMTSSLLFATSGYLEEMADPSTALPVFKRTQNVFSIRLVNCLLCASVPTNLRCQAFAEVLNHKLDVVHRSSASTRFLSEQAMMDLGKHPDLSLVLQDNMRAGVLNLDQAIFWASWAIGALDGSFPRTGLDLIASIPPFLRTHILETQSLMGDLGVQAEMAHKCGRPQHVRQLMQLWPELGRAKVKHTYSIVEDHFIHADKLLEMMRESPASSPSSTQNVASMIKTTMSEIQFCVLQALGDIFTDEDCCRMCSLCAPHQKDLKGSFPQEWLARADRYVIEQGIKEVTSPSYKTNTVKKM